MTIRIDHLILDYLGNTKRWTDTDDIVDNVSNHLVPFDISFIEGHFGMSSNPREAARRSLVEAHLLLLLQAQRIEIKEDEDFPDGSYKLVGQAPTTIQQVSSVLSVQDLMDTCSIESSFVDGSPVIAVNLDGHEYLLTPAACDWLTDELNQHSIGIRGENLMLLAEIKKG